ncbi:MAG: alpha/beta fold hydrolase [Candidatus Heimdallarchaeaceae archaeon]
MSSEFEQYATAQYVEVGETGTDFLRIHHSEPEGEVKDTLVLLPGFGSLPSAWDKVLLEMMKDYRIYVIETREKHTAQLGKKPEFSPERFARDVAEVIDYLELKDYLMIASSYGAGFTLLSMSMGLMAPKSVYMVGPVLRVEVPSYTWPFVYIMSRPLWYLLVKPIAKFVIKYFYLDRSQKEQAKKYHGYFDSYNIKRVKKTMMIQRKFKITDEQLAKVKGNCIFVAAEKDKAHAADITIRIHENVKDSKYYDQ